MTVIKRFFCILLCLLLTTTIGCSTVDENYQRPESPQHQWEDFIPLRTVSAPLNFLTLDGKHLMVEMRNVTVAEGQTDVEAVLRALISGPQDDQTMRRVLTSSIELVSTEVSRRVANIELSTSYTFYREDEMLKVRVAIANTLSSLLELDYINVYVDGMDPGYLGQPLGASKATTLDLTLYCDQVIQELKNITDDDDYEERRIITYYIPDESGSYLMADPEECSIYSTTTGETVERNYLRTVVFGLMTGTRADLFGGFNLGSVEPSIVLDENGRKSAFVLLRTLPENQALAYGSLVYSITGFVCNITHVTLAVEDSNAPEGYRLIEEVPGLGSFPGGIFNRSDFSHLIGDDITLYYPLRDGHGLRTVSRAVSQALSQDPVRILQELLCVPIESETCFLPVQDVQLEDILGAKLCGNTAVVNFSASFLEKCQTLSALEESSLIYSIVNTLSEVSGISQVQFLFEGKSIDQLGSLNLSGPLMRNPGVIAS